MGKRIVFVDEAIFSRSTCQLRTYNRKKEHHTINKTKLEGKPTYIVAAISVEYGVEAVNVYDKSINGKMFGQVLRNVKLLGDNFVLFGDCVKYHTSNYMKNLYALTNSSFIESIPYTPILNPIERYFCALKAVFKRRKLQKIIDNKRINVPYLINEARLQV